MSAAAPVLIKERMPHEEFMGWCDEDTKADLIEGVIVVQTRNYLQNKASRLPSSLLSIPATCMTGALQHFSLLTLSHVWPEFSIS